MGRPVSYTVLIKFMECETMERIIDLTAFLPSQEIDAPKRTALSTRQTFRLIADFLDAAVSATIGIGILTFFVILFTI